MTKEAMKLALDALGYVLTPHGGTRAHVWDSDEARFVVQAYKVLEEALAKQEQGEHYKCVIEGVQKLFDDKRKSKQEQSTECVGEPVAWEGFTNFANPLGTRLIFTTKFEADEWLRDFVEGHAWLKPLSYTTPYVATQRAQLPEAPL